jgi:hypothetical protein
MGNFEVWVTPEGKEKVQIWSKINGDGRLNMSEFIERFKKAMSE